MIALSDGCGRGSSVRELFETVYQVKRRNVSPKTRQKMAHELTRWERLSGDPPASLITGDTFDSARDVGLSLGLSSDTIETTLSTVLTVLRFAKKHGEIETVPDEGERLRRRRTRKPVPSLADLEAAYLHADAATWPRLGIPPGDFWRAWLATSYFTGLRLGDMMRGLSWDFLSADSIAMEASKTRKFHVFPLTPVFSRHLDLMRGVDLDRIIPIRHRRVFPIANSAYHVRRELKKISQAAELRVLGPQALRRLAATQWQKAKWGAGQMLMGHSLGVSDRYIAPELLQDAVKLLEIPLAFLTEAERHQKRLSREAVLIRWESLDESAREMLVALLDKLSR